MTTAQGNSLARLARRLHEAGYRFVTVTPETHRRVLAREPERRAASLRDVFGWNRPFSADLLDADTWALLQEAGAVMRHGDLCRSTVRFSTLHDIAYVHSAYPTADSDAVFFGPDTYRFAALIARELARSPSAARRVADVGCGAGAGGLVAGRLLQRATGSAPDVELIDINAHALDYARVNATTFGLGRVSFKCADLYAQTQPGLDLIVANPPYLVDPGERLYRHGGGRFGSALSERIVAEGLPMLSSGGMLVLYTGAPIVDGRDPFREAATALVDRSRYGFDYCELDPDVFGESLDDPAYEGVERIAAVGLVVRALD